MEPFLEWGGAALIMLGYWRLISMDIPWGTALSALGCLSLMVWATMLGYQGLLLLNIALFAINARGFFCFMSLKKERDRGN